MASDYSAFLSLPGKLDAEEAAWAEAPHEGEQAALIRETCAEHGLRSIVEFGCATGWMPHYLRDTSTHYLGIDANPNCLARAAEKCPGTLFLRGDIRTVHAPQADLVVAFAVLKHFHLAEWDAVLTRILSHGRYGLFSVTIADRCYEDDLEFPHVWVTEARLRRVVAAAGHEIVSFPWGQECPSEWMVLTRRAENSESAA